jgi:MYXO-CTERM domain-containing protein
MGNRFALTTTGLLLLGAFSTPVFGYVLTGVDWTWQAAPISTPFDFNATGWPAATGTEVEIAAAYKESINVWNTQGGAGFTVIYGGETTQNSWNYDTTNIGQYSNTQTSGSTIALAAYWFSGSDIDDCDIRFYAANDFGAIDWSADPAGAPWYAMDFAQTAEHELGHCFGLDHSQYNSAIMAGSSAPGSGPAERDLHFDDIDGIQAIYGAVSTSLAYDGHGIDDDQAGSSNGNADGIADGGEIIELEVDVTNFGSLTATGVTGVLTTTSPFLSISTVSADYGDLSAAATATGVFVVDISNTCSADFTAPMLLTTTDDTGNLWTDYFDLNVACGGAASPDLSFDGLTVLDPAPKGDNDGIPEGGERIELLVDLANLGAADATNITGIFSENDPTVKFIGNGAANWPNIAAGTIATQSASVRMDINGGCTANYSVPISLDLSSSQGNWSIPFDLTVICTNGPELVYSSHAPDDSAGDGDGLTEAGEVIRLDVEIFNAGDADATGVTGSVSTTSNMVTITDSAGGWADVAAAGIERTTDNFEFEVDINCTTPTVATFDLTLQSQGTSWQDTFDVQLECSSNDGDGDGSSRPADCDDADPNVYPGATEICDGIDNDCDGDIDSADTNITGELTWYLDADDDGQGDPNNTLISCNAPAGYVDVNTDCDDTTDLIYEGALEACDGIDNDCDGTPDDGLTFINYYEDNDGDGHGLPGTGVSACAQPAGYVASFDDCDDTDITTYTGATELCDGIDNDCNSIIDDGMTRITYYLDGDGDGHGIPGTGIEDCSLPAGYSESYLDCDDGNSAINPDADEVCDSIDNDCDGTIDIGASDASTWYADTDGDTYGDPANTVAECALPAGYVADSTDCDDTDAQVNSEGIEMCDGVDNDCDGTVDQNATNPSVWYEDSDGDTYGNLLSLVSACDAPAGYVGDGTDCDDTNAAIYIGAAEVCDGIDNDCDGDIDDQDGDVTGLFVWYLDSDTDGYGVPGGTVDSCTQPLGYADNTEDCDDTSSVINPGMPELCDNVDNDCNSLIDDNVVNVPWYLDADGDGYGLDSDFIDSCKVETGRSINGGDCDDTDNTINPAAVELCDGIDNDCTGTADDGITIPTWYLDGDSDTYGDPNTSLQECSQPAGYVSQQGDCDDSTDTAYPGNTEICDSIDNNCDGEVDVNAIDIQRWYDDADGDSYGDASSWQDACFGAADEVLDDTDCDDTRDDVNPGMTELCDGIDNDCNGSSDEGLQTFTWYLDGDGDGYGDSASTVDSCGAPPGYVGDATDCDDGDSAISPGADEVCDGVDNDCDAAVDEDDPAGLPLWYPDLDLDGFGDDAGYIAACDQPVDYVDVAGDCDDANNAVNPFQAELCDGVDNDCDGDADSDAIDMITYYADGDGDGFGEAASPFDACDIGFGRVDDATDCDDSDVLTYPGAPELCDGIDNDCDTEVDENIAIVDWYLDTDGDGYGDPNSTVSGCAPVDGYVSLGSDCNDLNGTISPAAIEECDGIDNDCSGVVDDNLPLYDHFIDGDGDGYGDPAQSIQSCETVVAGYVPDGGDCDDTDSTRSPGASEVCDGQDNDCDALIDDGLTSYNFYVDGDGDGFGDLTQPTKYCEEIPGLVIDSTDCDDTNPVTYPGATEICDGADNDCDLIIDDGLDLEFFYADGDGDGFGDANSAIEVCAAPNGYTDDATDCVDTNEDINPDATEVCDGVDNNCDGQIDESDPDTDTTWYPDVDGDGYGDASQSVNSCEPLEGYVQTLGDCNDNDPLINPEAEEVWYDDVDQDCDGNDQDQDGDGWWQRDDCDDLDPESFPGDGVHNDDCDTLDTINADKSSDGCGCSTQQAPGLSWLWLAAVLGLVIRRKQQNYPNDSLLQNG